MEENDFGPRNFNYWNHQVIKATIEENDLVLLIQLRFTTGTLKFVDVKDFEKRDDIISKKFFSCQHKDLDDHYKLYRIEFIDESTMDIIAKNKVYME